MQKKRVSSPREFCERYGITLPTFYREAASGRLVVLKIGRKNIITEEAEKNWLNALPRLDVEAA